MRAVALASLSLLVAYQNNVVACLGIAGRGAEPSTQIVRLRASSSGNPLASLRYQQHANIGEASVKRWSKCACAYGDQQQD